MKESGLTDIALHYMVALNEWQVYINRVGIMDLLFRESGVVIAV